jgi:hypothetical protein
MSSPRSFEDHPWKRGEINVLNSCPNPVEPAVRELNNPQTNINTVRFFFENGLYYLIVKYYIRLLHSGDAHSRFKQGSESSKKKNK